MNATSKRNTLRLAALSTLAALSIGTPALRAADHGDSPTVAHDQATDLADLYFFLDPTDNTKAILIGTFHGFITPGEASNFAIFDPAARYVFEIYNDHVNLPAEEVNPKKIKPNKTIAVTFNQRVGITDSLAVAGKEALQIPDKQTATFQFTGFDGINKKQKFTAPCLNPSLGGSSPDQLSAITTLSAGGIKVFVGEVDDPFFFDIPGFARTIAGIRQGNLPGDFKTNTDFLGRGRDTFAGYNILSIAISVPLDLIKGTNGDKVGASFIAQRHQVEQPRNGEVKGIGVFRQVDRIANPAVNVVLVPFSQKNAYNAGTPKDDANQKFLGGDDKPKTPIGILDTLTALGVSTPNIQALAGIAVAHGDVLTLDTSIANSGTNSEAAFPNGRRLTDDVVDTLLFVVTNGGVTPQVVATVTPGGDNVGANDVAFGSAFPFLAPTQQPRTTGTLDDGTRN